MINLDQLKPGQFLLSSHGAKREYVGRVPAVGGDIIITYSSTGSKFPFAWPPQKYQDWTIWEEWEDVTPHCQLNEHSFSLNSYYSVEEPINRYALYHRGLIVNSDQGYRVTLTNGQLKVEKRRNP